MEGYNVHEVADKIVEAIEKEYRELKTLNVMVLGKTGVGKSTLINNMFNEKITETGVGRPVTDKIRKIEVPNFPLAIYDTPGLELAGENVIDSLLDEVISEIDKGIRSGDINNAIHCIWYCISTPSHRFEQAEIEFLEQFLSKTSDYNVPVVIVLTQSYSKKDARTLKYEIEKENLPIANIIPILAEDYDIDDEYIAKSYGLDRLSEVMYNVIPDAVKKTFVAIQRVNLELKKGRAKAIVAASAVAAGAIGAIPIPFSDAAVLVPEQVAMIASITAVFGIPIEKSAIIAIVSSTIGTTGATIMGRTIVANLVKFIPAVGSFVGGCISSTTAAALTAALGEAYITIMLKVCKGEMNIKDLTTEKGKKEITSIFIEELKTKRTKTRTQD